MIDVRDLVKNYGHFEAVKGISFSISAGEVVGFLGPNGAGKTTTMRVLTGFLGANGGTVEIDQKPINQNPEEAKSKIGYLPENNPLYEEMTVIEYLDFIASVRGLDVARRKQQIQKNLTLYGLTDVASKDIGELSKGYRQRVGLAKAAIDDPPILILDEPTSGLDPNQIIEIRNLIKEMGRKKTVILSTHNLSEVEATCNRIIIINKGRIVADDTTEALANRKTRKVYSIRLLGAQQPEKILDELPGVVQVVTEKDQDKGVRIRLTAAAQSDQTETGEAIFDAVVANGWKLTELREESVSLEDVFTQLTKE